MVMVFESRNIKFKINANDHNPPHVHAEGLGCKLRVNLLTFEPMDKTTGFSLAAVRMIIEEVKNRQEELLNQWRDYHE
jgi:hypothetical protein